MKFFLTLMVPSVVFLSACSPIEPLGNSPDITAVIEINDEQVSFKELQETAPLVMMCLPYFGQVS